MPPVLPAPNGLLCIAYYFPPIHSVAVSRTYHFSKHLQQHFSYVEVLTTTNAKHLAQQPIPTNDMEITSCLTIDYRTIAQVFLNSFGQKKSVKTHYSEATKQHHFVKILIRLNDSLPFSLLIGEGGLFFIIAAFFKAARSIRQNNITHIFSIYRPTACHVVAWLLKLRFPHLFWIADFQDVPVDYSRPHGYFPKLQWKIYRLMFKKCDVPITISEGLSEQLSAGIGVQFHVIRDGVVQRSFVKKEASKFQFCYTGSVYQGMQSPEMLLRAIRQLLEEGVLQYEKIAFHYAGKDSALWQQWMREFDLLSVFTDHQFVSVETAQQLQNNAHINLLLTWRTGLAKGIVTGKIYDYLAAQNPIMLIVNGLEDVEMEQFFEKMQCGKVFYHREDNLKAIKKWIVDLYQAWMSDSLAQPYIATEKVQSLTWEAHTAQLLQLL